MKLLSIIQWGTAVLALIVICNAAVLAKQKIKVGVTNSPSIPVLEGDTRSTNALIPGKRSLPLQPGQDLYMTAMHQIMRQDNGSKSLGSGVPKQQVQVGTGSSGLGWGAGGPGSGGGGAYATGGGAAAGGGGGTSKGGSGGGTGVSTGAHGDSKACMSDVCAGGEAFGAHESGNNFNKTKGRPGSSGFGFGSGSPGKGGGGGMGVNGGGGSGAGSGDKHGGAGGGSAAAAGGASSGSGKTKTSFGYGNIKGLGYNPAPSSVLTPQKRAVQLLHQTHAKRQTRDMNEKSNEQGGHRRNSRGKSFSPPIPTAIPIKGTASSGKVSHNPKLSKARPKTQSFPTAVPISKQNRQAKQSSSGGSLEMRVN